MDTLNELRFKKGKLEKEIDILVNEKIKIQRKIDEIEFGVKIGDKVTYDENKYIVIKFETFWIKGRLIKKDGTVGIKESHLYNFKRKGN